jgi:hypothetical protein
MIKDSKLKNFTQPTIHITNDIDPLEGLTIQVSVKFKKCNTLKNNFRIQRPERFSALKMI